VSAPSSSPSKSGPRHSHLLLPHTQRYPPSPLSSSPPLPLSFKGKTARDLRIGPWPSLPEFVRLHDARACLCPTHPCRRRCCPARSARRQEAGERTRREGKSLQVTCFSVPAVFSVIFQSAQGTTAIFRCFTARLGWRAVRPATLPLLPTISNPAQFLSAPSPRPADIAVPARSAATLFELLLLFFHFYGFVYNYRANLVSLQFGGIVKRARACQPEICFCDPIDASMVLVGEREKARPWGQCREGWRKSQVLTERVRRASAMQAECSVMCWEGAGERTKEGGDSSRFSLAKCGVKVRPCGCAPQGPLR